MDKKQSKEVKAGDISADNLLAKNKNDDIDDTFFELFLLVSKFIYLRSWCPKFPCFSNLINKNRIKFAF